MSQQIIHDLENEYLKSEPPQFEIGDTVGVHVRIIEGEKQRVQVFRGTVIARRGRGTNEKFTVRRIVNGEGVERIFPVHSPRIAKIEVVRSGIVRRAKLYFLRDRVGKKTRLKERRIVRKKDVKVEGEESIAEAEARKAEEEAKIAEAEAEKARQAEEARKAEKARQEAEKARKAEKAAEDEADKEQAEAPAEQPAEQPQEAPAEDAPSDDEAKSE
jgi:large subunit ribosomal protein L19